MKKEKSFELADYFLMLLLLTSTDTLLFGTNSKQQFLYVPRIMGILACILIPFLTHHSIRYIKLNMELWCTLLFVSIFIISGVINKEPIVTTLSRIISVITAYTIVQYFDFSRFLHTFCCFIYFITLIAIIVEVCAYILPNLITFFPRVENSSGEVFYSFLVGGLQAKELGHVLIRSNGIFWEQGAYAIYLVFTLIMELFGFETINIKHLIVESLGLIITFSTTGYIVLGVIIITFLLSSRSENYSKFIKIFMGIGIMIFLLGVIVSENSVIFQGVFGKVINSETSSSTSTRLSSIYNGMKVAMMHPLFGVAGNTGQYMAIMITSLGAKYTIGGTIISNTIVGLTASYGMIFGFIFVLGTMKYSKKLAESKKTMILIFTAIVLAYCGERFFSFMPFIFALYGFKKWR